MKLETDVSQPSETLIGLSERAQSLCARAKALEEAGEFEQARAAIGEFWQRIGERPQIEGLDSIARAEVLLRTGALSGWIGSARQITGAQEIAKDLISEAARIFEQEELRERVAEARVDLAICYWREGAFDEARVSLDEALHQLGNLQSEQRLRAFLNRAIVEKVSNRYDDALKTHLEAAPLFAVSSNNILKGKFHNEYATVLKNVGLARNREDYIDRALVEYSAASFHAEQAGNKRFLALVENNVGYLFVRLGRSADAQQHLDRARSLFIGLKDKGMVAQVDDTRARALIAQGEFAKAEKLARSSVRALEEGDELSLLAEALTTHGTALARLGNFSRARATLEKAIRTAHNGGDPESGGVAALSMTEELNTHLPYSELVSYFHMAELELVGSQHPEIQSRLGKCARALMAKGSLGVSEQTTTGIAALPTPAETKAPESSTPTGTLEEQVLLYEGNVIRQALEASEGSVTRAARLLGITHQGLAFILNGRHKNLLASRKPVKRRRRSIIRFH
ncbi:MAG TPA: helix-turn-helix domain-containing protein [Pyrinomonadaceae bacterium]|nr:helix-turn-helix domain-containing protein [Pyrinomonadaceae bacterium]